MSTKQRKGDFIRTWSGKSFYPLDPDPEQIDIQDIAWALSMQCRYAGHVKHFYSVAQHSVYVSKACDESDALWGLLHDASEAYIQDIIRPVKIHLSEYKVIEARREKVIAERFNLCWPMPKSVKRADEAVYATEVIQLRPKFHGWNGSN